MITVTFGSNKHDVDLSALCASTSQAPPCLADLKALLETLCGVERERQRLILRGKTLAPDDTPLADLSLKDGDRLMLLAGKPPPSHPALQTMRSISSTTVPQLNSDLAEIESQLLGIEQGHLPQCHHAEALQKLRKCLLALNERSFKTLELLDSLDVSAGGDSVDRNAVAAAERARGMRKETVRAVQAVETRHDALKERVAALLEVELNGSTTV